MMSKRRGLNKIYVIAFLIVALSIFFSIKSMASANTVNLKIETSPTSSFFKANNLAPGDTVSEILKIVNAGDTRFAYKVSSRMEDGSEELFNYLKLKIDQGGTTITETNLSNLSNLHLGELAVNTEATASDAHFFFNMTHPPIFHKFFVNYTHFRKNSHNK